MSTIVKKASHIIHQIAGCDSCDWTDYSFDTARTSAKKHTEKTGHTTWVETGYHDSYRKHL